MRVRFRHLVAGLSAAALAAAGLSASQAQAKSLADAYNITGQDLFRQFSARPGNIVFSPYSIGTAMAMAFSGARGQTEAQMASVLHFADPRADVDAANARLIATLNGYDKSAVPAECPAGTKADGTTCKGPRPAGGGCPFPLRAEGHQCTGPAKRAPSAKLSIANALMLTKLGGDIAPGYVALMKEKFAAEAFKNAGLAEVNGWVKRKTDGKIPKILDGLDKNAPLVLLNAVYFKAPWQSPFNKKYTADAVFHLTPVKDAKVPTMRQAASFAVQDYPGYKAIRLPYVVPSLSLIVVVPDEIDGLRDVTKRLDDIGAAKLLTDMRSAHYRQVDLTLPRFKASFGADLVGAFQQAGLTLPFEDRADFSGMTGRPPSERGVKIGQIVHKAVIEVEEEGTEAAAATAIVMVRTAAAPQPPEPFHVDRPFLFFLSDDATGAILFQGRINDPR